MTLTTGGRKSSWKVLSLNGDVLSDELCQVQKYCSYMSRYKYRIMVNAEDNSKYSDYRIGASNDAQSILSSWAYVHNTIPKLIPSELNSIEEKQDWLVHHIKSLWKEQERLVKIKELKETSQLIKFDKQLISTPIVTDSSDDDFSVDDESDDGSERHAIPVTGSHSMPTFSDHQESEDTTLLRGSSVPTIVEESSPKKERKTGTTESTLKRSGMFKRLTKKGNAAELGKDHLTATLYDKEREKQTDNSTLLPLSLNDKYTTIASLLEWLKSIFSEDATRDERTMKYTILLVVFGTLYAMILRFCSLDLFLCLLAVNCYVYYYLVKERRRFIVMAAKRKLKRAARQEKKKWYNWFGLNVGNGSVTVNPPINSNPSSPQTLVNATVTTQEEKTL